MSTKRTMVMICALGALTAGFSKPTSSPKFCSNGNFKIDSSGNVVRAIFPHDEASGKRSERAIFADAIGVGRQISLNLVLDMGSGKAFIVTGVTSSNSRTLSGEEPVIISSIWAPKYILAGSGDRVEDRLPSGELVSVVVESTGRIFVDGLPSPELKTATWCID